VFDAAWFFDPYVRAGSADRPPSTTAKIMPNFNGADGVAYARTLIVDCGPKIDKPLNMFELYDLLQ
jgi:hypothetical protein